MKLRKKTLEVAAAHPDSSTIDFEYDGIKWHGRVEKRVRDE